MSGNCRGSSQGGRHGPCLQEVPTSTHLHLTQDEDAWRPTEKWCNQLFCNVVPMLLGNEEEELGGRQHFDLDTFLSDISDTLFTMTQTPSTHQALPEDGRCPKPCWNWKRRSRQTACPRQISASWLQTESCCLWQTGPPPVLDNPNTAAALETQSSQWLHVLSRARWAVMPQVAAREARTHLIPDSMAALPVWDCSSLSLLARFQAAPAAPASASSCTWISCFFLLFHGGFRVDEAPDVLVGSMVG